MGLSYDAHKELRWLRERMDASKHARDIQAGVLDEDVQQELLDMQDRCPCLYAELRTTNAKDFVQAVLQCATPVDEAPSTPSSCARAANLRRIISLPRHYL